MTNIPHLVFARKPTGYGPAALVDPIHFDGLTDMHNKLLQGTMCETIFNKMGITRKEQDEYAIQSYKKAVDAKNKGFLLREI